MKVGMAVIGCGRIGQVHLRSIAKLSNLANLVAVVDSCEEIAIKSANKFSAKRWYSSIDVALEDEEISAVVVALPHLFHKDVTIKAAKAGKHILVEKPLALNLAQTDAMIEACESARVTLLPSTSTC
jgi:predicted dehydrogenase